MDIKTIVKILPGKTGEHNTYLPLWMHLQDTALVMEYLCKKRVSDSVIRATGLERVSFYTICRFLALIHDIGKCTPRFVSNISMHLPCNLEKLSQRGLVIPLLSEYAFSGTISHASHALAGKILLRHFGCPDGICAIVGAHHGKPSNARDCTYNAESHMDTYLRVYYANQKAVWQKMQEVFLNDALEKCQYSSVAELPQLSNCAQMLLSGLVIEADWIASNQTYFSLLNEDDEGTETVYPVRSQQALETLALTDVWNANCRTNDQKRFFIDRFGFEPNSVQTVAVEVSQNASDFGGLMIIEAQMGVGKTEAALAAAEIMAQKAGCGGLFFGLPTQATSNGIFPRLVQWAKQVSQDSAHSIRLVHSMAELNEDYRRLLFQKSNIDEDEDGGITVNSWFSGRKQAMLADFVVGTVDSALMAALKQKHVMLRHLGLCGKVVVIDECHAYDAYMSQFLFCLLRWLGAYQVPVILLSATLPKEKKRQLIQAYCMPFPGKKRISLPESIGYPMLTWADQNGIKEVPVKYSAQNAIVKILTLAEEKIADTLRKCMAEGGCAGIIVNTVKRAQKIAATLKDQLPEKKVYVYHAQFLAQERIRRERELITRIGKGSSSEQRDNVIIVGTQVLEQSLDIDFDYLITDLCPMDLLLQRIGRLHRHHRVRPTLLREPVCSVLCADDELESGAKVIYGEWLLKQTKRYLPERIQLPGDIPNLVNRVYAEPDDMEKTDSAWEQFQTRTAIKKNQADDWCLSKPEIPNTESDNSIIDLLKDAIESDKKDEAKVRDGIASIDVLVMCRHGEDYVGFMPWIESSYLRYDTVPSEEEARQIALQRIRLPFIFNVGKKLDETIDILERENRERLIAWQESPWIKGELILLLDENGEKDLCGYHIRYEKENGLLYERLSE